MFDPRETCSEGRGDNLNKCVIPAKAGTHASSIIKKAWVLASARMTGKNMIIYIGSDHGGFDLKEHLKEVLKNLAYEVADMGPAVKVPSDDYVDYAKAVAEKISLAPETDRGILICRSGFGMDIAANKFNHVRAALASTPDEMFQGRHDDNVNVLCLAADFVDAATAEKIVKVFLSTPFATEDRYARRLAKIDKIESEKAQQ